MYNIRIKSVPNKAKTGSQLDYSLVDRNTLFLKPNTPVNSDVKNTMGAVPREQANIEAEGGETVVGDINNDGFLEHQTIVGKRHTQGGVPLNVPEGSFIFSDTKKMIVKDPEVLSMFGMKPSKAGYTPAEIAKKYNINDYIAILKDTAKDNYSKQTAQIMLESNLKKLGMLALIQESMKGFPDGVPAIAESVMGQIQGNQETPQQEQAETPEEQGPQEEMMEGQQPQQKFGGQLPKAQNGKNKKTTLIKKNDPYTGYWDRVADRIGSSYYSRSGKYTEDPRVTQAARKLNPFSDEYNGEGFFGGAWDYLGNVASMPQKEMNHFLTGLYESPGTTVQRYHEIDPKTKFAIDLIDPLILEDVIEKGVQKVAPKVVKGTKYVGTQIYKGGKYIGEKAAPYVNKTIQAVKPAIKYVKKVWDDIPIEKKALIIEKLSQASTHIDEASNKPVDLEQLYRAEKTNNKPSTPSKLSIPEAPKPITEQSNKSNNTFPNTTSGQSTSNERKIGEDNTPKVTHKDKVGKVYQNPRSIKPVKQTTPIQDINTSGSVIFDTSGETDRGYEYGGLYHMQVGGGTPKFNTSTGMYQNYDASGKPIGDAYTSGVRYNVKDADVLEKAKTAGYDIIGNKHAPNITYIGPQTSKTGFVPGKESGIYESKQFPIGKQGLDELTNNWKDELSNYEGPSGKGVEAWKTDILNAKGKPSAASRFYALEANKSSNAAGLGNQIDPNVEGWDVPGQEWYSTKKFTKKPVEQVAAVTPSETPAKKENNINVNTITPSPFINRGGWSKNATLNFANSFLADRYHGQAVLPKYNAETPDYSLLNPAQAIAQMQSSVNSLNNQAANTMSGNQAFAAGLSLTGQGIDKAAGIQGEYDNKNVGIANRANEVSADIANRTNQLNQNAKYQYNNDIQTLGQQEVNTNNAYRSNVIKSMIGANQEDEKTRALQTMFPQVGIDHWNHDIGWSGVGRNPFGYDTYVNPSGTGTGKGTKGFAQGFDHDSINDIAGQIYTKAYNSTVGSMGHEHASDYAKQMALAAAKQQMNTAPGYGTNVASNVYDSMFN